MITNKEHSNLLKNYKTSLIINELYSKPKYMKVMFENKEFNFKYKIDEVNTANNWNPNTSEPEQMGGFDFYTEDKILRWLVNGDTVYDVIIPDGTKIIECSSELSPLGVIKSNKIIPTNPRHITDELAMNFYLKSNLPDKEYYKSLAGVAIMGYRNTALMIIKDKINKDNITLALSEIENFIKSYQNKEIKKIFENNSEVYNEVMGILNNIKQNNGYS